ncbi:hypothetical protein EMIT0194P_100186 [Pseudomonas serbica]
MTLSIHSLEKRLGISLFERHVDGMRLTEYGECIVHRASCLGLAGQWMRFSPTSASLYLAQ